MTHMRIDNNKNNNKKFQNDDKLKSAGTDKRKVVKNRAGGAASARSGSFAVSDNFFPRKNASLRPTLNRASVRLDRK